MLEVFLLPQSRFMEAKLADLSLILNKSFVLFFKDFVNNQFICVIWISLKRLSISYKTFEDQLSQILGS
jgi:hypothetical protein